MNKLVKMRIKNFQAHRDREFYFSDYTGIVGPTNKGKTSIVRAMMWCLYNIPSGNSFITKGEEECSVTLMFESGLEITRSKSNRKNNYHVIMPDGSEFDLDSFGSGPVTEIINLHNMRLIDYLDEERALNFRTQLEPPFFLGESATVRNVMIGKLGHSDIVDAATKNAASTLRAKNALKKELNQKIKEINNEIKSFGNLDKEEKAIGTIRDNLSRIEYLNERYNKILALKEKYDVLIKEREKFVKIAGAEYLVDGVIEMINEAVLKFNQAVAINQSKNSYNEFITQKQECERCILRENDIGDSLNLIEEILKLISKGKSVSAAKKEFDKLTDESSKLSKIASIDYQTAETKINSMIELFNKGKKIKGIKNEYDELKRTEMLAASDVTSKNETYEKYSNQYENALTEMSICPVCLSKISETKRNKLMSEVKL